MAYNVNAWAQLYWLGAMQAWSTDHAENKSTASPEVGSFRRFLPERVWRVCLTIRGALHIESFINCILLP